MTDTEDTGTPEARRAHWAADRAAANKRLAEHKPTDTADDLCHDASIKAAQWARDDGLYPEYFTEWNEPRYSVQQGLRAAHVGREDSAATLILMRPLLRYLTSISRLLFIVIALLAVLLWRVW